MDDDIDLIGADAKEPASFDDLEALVHHGGGIDGDAVAHAPVGMREGLFDSNVGEIFDGRLAKRTAGSGKNEAADFGIEGSFGWLLGSEFRSGNECAWRGEEITYQRPVITGQVTFCPRETLEKAPAGAEALVDSVVLGIDGEQFPARLSGGGHDEFAGSDEYFFVGESDGAAELDGFVGGFEADHADSGGNNDVGTGVRSDGEHAFAAMVDGGKWVEILFAEAAGEFIGKLRSGEGDDVGMMAKDLAAELVEIVAGGEGDYVEVIGERFDDGESLPANGAGGAEDGEKFHKKSVVSSRYFVMKPKMAA
jgi:hypothetical protein